MQPIAENLLTVGIEVGKAKTPSESEYQNKKINNQVPFFKVFGMIRLGIEPRSPRPLANNLPTRTMSWLCNLIEY